MKLNRIFYQWVFGIIFFIWIIITAPKFDKLDIIFNIIGLLLLFVGILGRIYSTLYIGGMKNVGYDGNSFIKDGVYKICRNPLYFFSFIGLLGLLFIKGEISLIIIGAILFLAIYRFTILGEEKYLREKYGESYEQFLNEVPRFFPKFSNFSYQDRIEIRPFYLHKEIKRAFVWIGSALLIYIISYLQIIEVLPILFRVI